MLQQGKFEKALAAFEKLRPEAPAEIKERCVMYINTCQRQMERPSLAFVTPEEHYDYAISQLNTGYYEEAREQFGNILTGHPDADYAFYGLALLDSIAGLPEESGPRHRTESPEQAPGPRRQRLSEHGGRSSLYRVAVP
jgi:tetratricopeptide (TPR) repeat protein